MSRENYTDRTRPFMRDHFISEYGIGVRPVYQFSLDIVKSTMEAIDKAQRTSARVYAIDKKSYVKRTQPKKG